MSTRAIFEDNPDDILKTKRVLLFCILDKCMSGIITHVEVIDDRTVIDIEFIEPEYFEPHLATGLKIEIREASRVLKVGEIIVTA